MIERGSSSYQICGINLRNADLDYMVYQVKYDSVFRTFRGMVEHDDRHLIINGKKIKVYSESDPALIPWDDCGAEYIIESTGAFNTTEKASVHLQNGAKKVILSAPAKDDVTPTFVMGVNHKMYTPDMDIVSNAFIACEICFSGDILENIAILFRSFSTGSYSRFFSKTKFGITTSFSPSNLSFKSFFRSFVSMTSLWMLSKWVR